MELARRSLAPKGGIAAAYAEGLHRNRPRSNRFENRHSPCPSRHRHLIAAATAKDKQMSAVRACGKVGWYHQVLTFHYPITSTGSRIAG